MIPMPCKDHQECPLTSANIRNPSSQGTQKESNSVPQPICVYGYINFFIIFKCFLFFPCSLDGQVEILSLGKGPFRKGAPWADISYSCTLT